MKRNKIYTIMLVICLGMMAGCRSEDSIKTGEAEILEDSAEDSTEEISGVQQKNSAEEMIYVQVSGAVVSPGVYELPAGSRVFEAIDQADGLTAEADAGQMNQAEILSDGQMIYVRKQGEEVLETPVQQEDGKVSLNTATEEQLMTLPGIGQAKAESIIAWREENGGFTRIEDLMKIEGIKEGVFSKIKDSIKVN